MIPKPSRRNWAVTAACIAPFVFIPFAPRAANLPDKDERAGPPKTLNTLRSFPEVKTRADWQARARDIREHVLVSCGLWPPPKKVSLQAEIFGRIERDGYSVEKVHIQTQPGFYLGGNLYRPLGKGQGPFPGVLNPHGHWRQGRLEDQVLGSIAARCINFARQGMVAFSYDLVGYNDTTQVNHKFASDPTNQLWGISLMGLQLWNSIRALDFLGSLADVDRSRLGCTGESGGGTQTFMLGAVEDRLAALAPIVMVSHSMQGGCLCENAPGLRVDFSNMELAAAAAPKPQILVAATGDWTKMTLTMEGPAIAGIYRLFGAEDRFRFVRFDYDHNYNQTSREAVYEWFGQWLLRHADPASLKEIAYQKEPDEALRVWPDGKLPPGALNENQLIERLIYQARSQLAGYWPGDAPTLARFKDMMRPAWRHTLQAELPENGLIVEAGKVETRSGFSETRLHIGRTGKGDRLPVVMLSPQEDKLRFLAVLAHTNGIASYYKDGVTKGLAGALLKKGCSVILLDTFLTGSLAHATELAARKPFDNFFSTYNRTDLQERVQDLITACAFARAHSKGRRIVLGGEGRAGLWAMLAAPAADAVVADGANLDLSTDRVLMQQDLFVPGLRRIGAFEGAVALAAPNPFLGHNIGNRVQRQSGPRYLCRREIRERSPPGREAIEGWRDRGLGRCLEVARGETARTILAACPSPMRTADLPQRGKTG